MKNRYLLNDISIDCPRPIGNPLNRRGSNNHKFMEGYGQIPWSLVVKTLIILYPYSRIMHSDHSGVTVLVLRLGQKCPVKDQHSQACVSHKMRVTVRSAHRQAAGAGLGPRNINKWHSSCHSLIRVRATWDVHGGGGEGEGTARV